MTKKVPKTKKPKFDYKELMKEVINPYRQTLVIKARECKSEDFTPKYVAGVELPVLVHSTFIREDEPITKLYILPKWRDIISKLSPNSTKLFTFIAYELESNSEIIWINVARFQKEFEVKSINTYKKSVIELQQKNIINPVAGYKNVYWINPQIFWRGDRPGTFPDNTTIRKLPKE